MHREEELTVKGERKTTRNIKTVGALLDRRRVRTEGGALLELASLAHERTRLKNELRRLQERHAEIEARLAEIAAKESWLRAAAEPQADGRLHGRDLARHGARLTPRADG